ncbi:MAG: hypothetical protein ABH837_03390 [bacterium]
MKKLIEKITEITDWYLKSSLFFKITIYLVVSTSLAVITLLFIYSNCQCYIEKPTTEQSNKSQFLEEDELQLESLGPDLGASFIWEKAYYSSNNFYIHQKAKNRKIISQNGDITNVFVEKSDIYLVINDTKLYKYNTENNAETYILSTTEPILDIKIQLNQKDIALLVEISDHTPTNEDNADLFVYNLETQIINKITTLDSHFEIFNLGAWSLGEKNILYVISHAGDAGHYRERIYKVNILTKSVTIFQEFSNNLYEGGDSFWGIDEKGEYFIAESSKITTIGEEQHSFLVESNLYKYNIKDLSAEVLIDFKKYFKDYFTDYKSLPWLDDILYNENFDQIFLAAYIYNDQEISNKSGLYQIKGNQIDKINVNFLFDSTNHFMFSLRATNNNFILYSNDTNSVKDKNKRAYKLYIYSLKEGKSSLVATGWNYMSFIGWL